MRVLEIWKHWRPEELASERHPGPLEGQGHSQVVSVAQRPEMVSKPQGGRSCMLVRGLS